MISSYAFFQTIIKSGEMIEKEAMSHLPHSNVRSYDKIDEILRNPVEYLITVSGNIPHFGKESLLW